MNKAKIKKTLFSSRYRKLLTFSGALVVLLVLLFLSRGWVRGTVYPWAVGIKEKPRIVQEFNGSRDEILPALTTAGFTESSGEVINETGYDAPNESACGLDTARLFSISVYCASQRFFATTTISIETLNETISKFVAADGLLKQAGWKSNNDADLTKIENLHAEPESNFSALYLKGNCSLIFYRDFNTTIVINADLACSKIIGKSVY